MTGAPVGMGMEKDVGAKRVGVNLNFFLLTLLNAPEKGMPTSLQIITIYPLGLKRVPSAKTVWEDIMLSCPMMGIMMKAPNQGNVLESNEYTARVRYIALETVDVDVAAEESNIVKRVYDHTYIGMERITGGRKMQIQTDNGHQMGTAR